MVYPVFHQSPAIHCQTQVPKDDAVLQKGLPLRRLRRTLAVTLLPLVPWTKKPVQVGLWKSPRIMIEKGVTSYISMLCFYMILPD